MHGGGLGLGPFFVCFSCKFGVHFSSRGVAGETRGGFWRTLLVTIFKSPISPMGVLKLISFGACWVSYLGDLGQHWRDLGATLVSWVGIGMTMWLPGVARGVPGEARGCVQLSGTEAAGAFNIAERYFGRF